MRKDVLARHQDLTLTKLYNTLEALRAAENGATVLACKERDVAERGCVSLIRQYHEEIDAAVAEAYGWPANLSDDEVLERLSPSIRNARPRRHRARCAGCAPSSRRRVMSRPPSR
jgi:hypothetical protein